MAIVSAFYRRLASSILFSINVQLLYSPTKDENYFTIPHRNLPIQVLQKKERRRNEEEIENLLFEKNNCHKFISQRCKCAYQNLTRMTEHFY